MNTKTNEENGMQTSLESSSGDEISSELSDKKKKKFGAVISQQKTTYWKYITEVYVELIENF